VLLVLGIVFVIAGVAATVLIGGANMMSDAPSSKGASLWPAGVLLALAVACFVARHFLHGAALHW
jgi:hypothetical protein